MDSHSNVFVLLYINIYIDQFRTGTDRTLPNPHSKFEKQRTKPSASFWGKVNRCKSTCRITNQFHHAPAHARSSTRREHRPVFQQFQVQSRAERARAPSAERGHGATGRLQPASRVAETEVLVVEAAKTEAFNVRCHEVPLARSVFTVFLFGVSKQPGRRVLVGIPHTLETKVLQSYIEKCRTHSNTSPSPQRVAVHSGDRAYRALGIVVSLLAV